MKKKYKILAIIYFIIMTIIVLNSDKLSALATSTLEYVKCGTADGIPRPVPQLFSIAYTLLIVGTPLVLIVFSIVELIKAITKGNADDIMKAKNKVFKKFLAAGIIFVLAAIVQFVILRVTSNDTDKKSVTSCIKCFLYYSETNCPTYVKK